VAWSLPAVTVERSRPRHRHPPTGLRARRHPVPAPTAPPVVAPSSTPHRAHRRVAKATTPPSASGRVAAMPPHTVHGAGAAVGATAEAPVVAPRALPAVAASAVGNGGGGDAVGGASGATGGVAAPADAGAGTSVMSVGLDRDVRPWLDLIDKLRAFGIEQVRGATGLEGWGRRGEGAVVMTVEANRLRQVPGRVGGFCHSGSVLTSVELCAPVFFPCVVDCAVATYSFPLLPPRYRTCLSPNCP